MVSTNGPGGNVAIPSIDYFGGYVGWSAFAG
jgi:hypothetical protein